ncbi:MAG: acyl-CoA dehydrogenase family protein [Dehalococcoidia bacterium]
MATLTETNTWLAKALTLAPLVEQYRDQSEEQRYLAKPLYEAMREMGLFKMWLPRSVGGYEVDFRTGVEVVEALARMDGSTGWNLIIALQSAWMMGYIEPESAAQMMEANPMATLGGSGAPNGIAIPVEGGYRVTGRWPFASGSKHTQWLCGVCRVRDGDGFRMKPDGTPELRFLFYSADQYEIVDTWNTTGLRGTGSHDFEINNAFVPEGRAIDTLVQRSAFQGGPLYQARFQQIFGWPLAFVGLGIAAEALDAFTEIADSKTPSRSRKRLAENENAQMSVGRALGKLNAGRAYLYDYCDRLWASMASGRGTDDALAIEGALASSNAAESAAEAVDLVRTAAGTSGIFVGNKLERCWRDVHTVTQHQNLSPSSFVKAGAFRLGLGVTTGR